MINPPDILALDFDGVLCDGLPEYFQSSWQAYCEIWYSEQQAPQIPPIGLESQFVRLRSVIETGWEMPLLIHALSQGIDEASLLGDWPQITAQLLEASGPNSTTLAQALDQVRDRAIQSDLSSWLALHQFYPEALVCLRSLLTQNSPTRPVIISTKEGRFIHQLLQMQGIFLPPSQVYGKEAQRPKSQILRELLKSDPTPQVWFIEDRLKTLISMQGLPDLTDVQLYLATWGYNTPEERLRIGNEHPSLASLSLNQLLQPLETWPVHHALSLQPRYR